MNEDFVTYEQAVKLKELGFDWGVTHYYIDDDSFVNKRLYPNGDYVEMLAKGGVVMIDDFVKNCNNIDGRISAPTLPQVQKWLREVKDIHIQSKICFIKFDWYAQIIKGLSYYPKIICATTHFDTYEKALSAGIDKALELLKEQNNGK